MHTKKTNNTNKLMQISYHSALTKIQKLQNLLKKNFFFLYRPVLPEIGRYSWYKASAASIFSGTKQGGNLYRFTGRYSIYWLYWPVWYRINFLDIHTSTLHPKCGKSPRWAVTLPDLWAYEAVMSSRAQSLPNSLMPLIGLQARVIELGT